MEGERTVKKRNLGKRALAMQESGVIIAILLFVLVITCVKSEG